MDIVTVAKDEVFSNLKARGQKVTYFWTILALSARSDLLRKTPRKFESFESETFKSGL